MKKQLFFLFTLLPLLAVAQYDFDSRYFTINAASLPEAPQFNQLTQFSQIPQLVKLSDEKLSSFTLDNTPTFAATLKSFKINASNYWQPVDMMGVVNTSKNYISTSLDVAPLKSDNFCFSVYTADNASKVKNTVYTEVRGLDLLDPCPTFGICPRCAPYRIGRGY